MTLGVTISVHLDGESVEQRLNQIEQALSPMALSAFMGNKVEPYMRSRIRARFMSEGDNAVGGPWLPLHPNTVLIREAEGFTGEHPINQRTGDMFAKLSQGSNEIRPNAGGATFFMPGPIGGKMRDKIRVAQHGNANNPRVPPRPVLGLDVADMMSVMTALALHISTAIGGTQVGPVSAL